MVVCYSTSQVSSGSYYLIRLSDRRYSTHISASPSGQATNAITTREPRATCNETYYYTHPLGFEVGRIILASLWILFAKGVSRTALFVILD